MTCGDVESAGPADADELRHSDEVLDRLGRRAPGPGDLDDPLIAILAVMAGDVDLLPVPVSASRRALVDAGVWPPWRKDSSAVPPCRHAVERPALHATVPKPFRPPAALPPVVPVSSAHKAPRRTLQGVIGSLLGDGSAARHRGGSSWARRAPGDRAVPRLDHPRVLRMRPAIGLAAAAMLAVLGGGVAVSASGSEDPLPGIGTVMQHWDGRPDRRPTRAALTARVEAARKALRRGDRKGARKVLSEVAGQLSTLSAADRRVVAAQVATVEQELRVGMMLGASGAVGGSSVSRSTVSRSTVSRSTVSRSTVSRSTVSRSTVSRSTALALRPPPDGDDAEGSAGPGDTGSGGSDPGAHLRPGQYVAVPGPGSPSGPGAGRDGHRGHPGGGGGGPQGAPGGR